MKKAVILSMVFLLFGFAGQAQTKQSSFRSSDTKIDIENLADPEVVLLFDDFKPAAVYYPDNRLVQMRVNYRLLADEMIIDDGTGNYKSLATGRRFDSIHVHNMVIVHDSNFGFLEKLEYPNITFYVKHQSLYVMNEIRPGAYGEAPASASTQNVNVPAALPSGAAHSDQIVLTNTSNNPMQVIVTRKPLLGIIEDNDFVTFANRRQFSRHFREYGSEIRGFIRQEGIRFDQVEDMKKLAAFTSSLKE